MKARKRLQHNVLVTEVRIVFVVLIFALACIYVDLTVTSYSHITQSASTSGQYHRQGHKQWSICAVCCIWNDLLVFRAVRLAFGFSFQKCLKIHCFIVAYVPIDLCVLSLLWCYTDYFIILMDTINNSVEFQQILQSSCYLCGIGMWWSVVIVGQNGPECHSTRWWCCSWFHLKHCQQYKRCLRVQFWWHHLSHFNPLWAH